MSNLGRDCKGWPEGATNPDSLFLDQGLWLSSRMRHWKEVLSPNGSIVHDMRAVMHLLRLPCIKVGSMSTLEKVHLGYAVFELEAMCHCKPAWEHSPLVSWAMKVWLCLMDQLGSWALWSWILLLFVPQCYKDADNQNRCLGHPWPPEGWATQYTHGLTKPCATQLLMVSQYPSSKIDVTAERGIFMDDIWRW